MSPNNPQKQKKLIEDFTRYSSLAFEMIAIMGIGVLAGYKIDHWLNMRFPVFTLVLMVSSVVGAIYHAIRKFL